MLFKIILNDFITSEIKIKLCLEFMFPNLILFQFFNCATMLASYPFRNFILECFFVFNLTK